MKKEVHTQELSEAQKQFASELSALQTAMHRAMAAHRIKKSECLHISSYTKDQGNWDCGSAWCALCGKDLGWYCPSSPDHACHYHTEDGKVKLAGGDLVDPPEDHDCDHESDDWCIFCGAPEERK